MKTSEELKLRLDGCGFECEGDNGTLIEDVVLLEDVVEKARGVDAHLDDFFQDEAGVKSLFELRFALAKLENNK